jgi:L-cysteine desulfidase
MEACGERIIFAYASLLVAVIEDSLTAAHGTLAMDLQECIRIWKKVRLG